MRKISKALRKGDMFGGQYGITFDGEDSHKTAVGFCCSILYLFIVVVSFIYFWMEYRDTANPNLGSELLIGSEFPNLNFGNHSFFFTISAIYEGRSLHYEEIIKIVDIKLASVEERVDPVDNKIKDYVTEKNLHKCMPEDFVIDGKDIKTSPSTKNGDLAFCPDDKNLQMKGHIEDEDFRFIRLQFLPCTTNCWGNLTTELENVFIQFGFTESAVVPSNYDYPFEYHLNKEYTFHLDERVEYFRKFFFRTLEVDTDKGNFLENIVQQSSLDLFNLIYEDGQRHTSDIPYLEIRLLSSNHNLYIQRSYVKFQDFLGNIGGVTSIAAVIIAILYSLYNDISLKLYIMNDTLFKYYVQRTGKKVTTFHVVKFILYSIFGKCCSSCFSQETKELSKLYFSGEDRLDDSMDVRNLVQNANDIKMIKKILFNEEQLILLSKVTNDDLVRDAEEDDEEEEGKQLTHKQKSLTRNRNLTKAQEYLDQVEGGDDIERRINRFLKDSIESNQDYEKAKSLGGEREQSKRIFKKEGRAKVGNADMFDEGKRAMVMVKGSNAGQAKDKRERDNTSMQFLDLDKSNQ